MPMSFLLGAILGTGRMADDREIMAMGAAGISPVRLVRVPLLLGLGVAALGLLLSMEIEPAGLREAGLRLNELIKRNVSANVRAGTFFDELPGYTVYAERVSPQGWSHVLISDRSDPGSPVLALARQGRLVPVGAGEAMVLELQQGEVHREEAASQDYVWAAFERASLSLGLGTTLSDQNSIAGSTKALTTDELLERSVPGPGRDASEALGFQVALARRISIPFAVLGFALIAVPVAALRRGGRAAGIGATVAGVLIHYLLLRAGEILAEARALPPLLALQLPNVVLLAIGLALCAVLARKGPGAVR
jgi:lipopolysaccharide export system permease protein